VPSGDAQWPRGAVVIGMDGAVIDALANPHMPPISGDGGLSSPNFSWNYWATLTCNADLQSSSGNIIVLGIGVHGGASITYHAPNGIPNPTVGASITGTCSAGTALTVVDSGTSQTLQVMLEGVGDFDLKLDLGSCPSFIADIINDCVSPIINDVVGKLTGSVPGTTYDLVTLPQFHIPLPNSGAGGTLSLTDLTSQIVPGPAGINVLALSGQVARTYPACRSWSRWHAGCRTPSTDGNARW
jgi:hypothetical protein